MVSAYNGRTSFMAKENLALLKELSSQLLIIPVTGRSVASYKSINLGIDFPYALVENGSVLLHHSSIDREWLRESMFIWSIWNNGVYKGDCAEVFKKGVKYLHDNGYKSKGNDYFAISFFNKGMTTKKSDSIREELENILGKYFDVYVGRENVYAILKSFSKGKAINRFFNKYKVVNPYSCAVAGDTVQDWSMFTETGIKLTIGSKTSPAKHTYDFDFLNRHYFTEYVLKTIKEAK